MQNALQMQNALMFCREHLEFEFELNTDSEKIEIY